MMLFLILNAMSSPVFSASSSEEINTVIEIDKQRTEDVRRMWPLLRDRRIDAYNEILQRYVD